MHYVKYFMCHLLNYYQDRNVKVSKLDNQLPLTFVVVSETLTPYK